MEKEKSGGYNPFVDIRSITVAGELRLAFPEHYENKSLRDTKPVPCLRRGDPTKYKVGVRNLIDEQEQPKDPLQILLEKEEVIIEVNEREAAINAGRGNGKTRPFRKGLPLHLRRMKNGGSALTGFTFAGVS
ncbi:hypothetical protein BMS3Abin15_00637 [bacterium BMS3Abin15]|nr:hypothetical protein BMS3Abin15_00637 [bacterium BMS3Abin15]HDH07577.1 hypothetical protein [Candidatus Moranbacteria bacterium]HDZ85298.1 hypothetical protein [Candidatus Moranbacteria bacterium]